MAGRGDTCEAGGACGGSLGWDGGLESPLANAFFTFITGRPPKIDVSSDDVLSVTVGFSVVLLWLSSFGDPIQPTTLPPLPPKLTNPIQFPLRSTCIFWNYPVHFYSDYLRRVDIRVSGYRTVTEQN